MVSPKTVLAVGAAVAALYLGARLLPGAAAGLGRLGAGLEGGLGTIGGSITSSLSRGFEGLFPPTTQEAPLPADVEYDEYIQGNSGATTAEFCAANPGSCCNGVIGSCQEQHTEPDQGTMPDQQTEASEQTVNYDEARERAYSTRETVDLTNYRDPGGFGPPARINTIQGPPSSGAGSSKIADAVRSQTIANYDDARERAYSTRGTVQGPPERSTTDLTNYRDPGGQGPPRPITNIQAPPSTGSTSSKIADAIRGSNSRAQNLIQQALNRRNPTYQERNAAAAAGQQGDPSSPDNITQSPRGVDLRSDERLNTYDADFNEPPPNNVIPQRVIDYAGPYADRLRYSTNLGGYYLGTPGSGIYNSRFYDPTARDDAQRDRQLRDALADQYRRSVQ